MRVAPPTWKLWTALGIVYVVWGSTYLAIRYAVTSLPPLTSASVRYALAAGLLGGYLLLRRGRGALRASRRQYAHAAVIGLLLLLGGNGGVNLAEKRGLPSGLTALLVASVPLWVVLLRLLARDRPSGQTLVGVAVGFGGVAVLLAPGSRGGVASTGAALLVLMASLLWSIGSFLSGRLDLPDDPLLGAVVQMAGGAVGLALCAALLGERVQWDQVQTSSLLAVGYLIVFGSVVAFTAYAWLLRVAPVSKVSTYAYVNPLVAVLLGAAFVGESLTALSVFGGALTLVAVALVVGQAPDEEHGRERSSAT